MFVGGEVSEVYSGRNSLSIWRLELAMPIWAAEVMRLQPLKWKQVASEEEGTGGWIGGLPTDEARRNHRHQPKRWKSTRGENEGAPWSETLNMDHVERVRKPRRLSQPALFSLTFPGCYHDVLNHVKFINTISRSIKFCNHEGQESIYLLRNHCFGWQKSLFSQQFPLTGFHFPMKYLLNICLT